MIGRRNNRPDRVFAPFNHAAVLKGPDVDQPRNLAKAVTVE
jgi:glucosamine 6-phosphate synthetase-like amidotransferase/phosphosugar isomerase protein